MAFNLLTDSQITELDRVMAWARIQMGLRTAETAPEALPGRVLPNIRGFLLQNVYSGGSGVMMLAKRLLVPNATQVTIIGTNYVDTSAFKLALNGIPKNMTNAQSKVIFTTGPILVNSTAAQMSNIIFTNAQAANLPVGPNDIAVALGNPTPSADLVLLPDPTMQPEVYNGAIPPEGWVGNWSPPTTPPISYVGSWVLYVSGVLANQYSNLVFTTVQDSTAFMKGMSAIVAKPMIDVPSNTPQIVWDVNNRPQDYPWTAGSLCVASHFIGIGYGIMNTDFRNQVISIPSFQPTP